MSREMKHSGIEWIGEIPKEWNCASFKYFHEKANVGESIDKSYCSDNPVDTLFYTAGIEPIHTIYKDFPQWKYTEINDLLLARNGTPYVYLPVPNSVYSDHIIRAEIKKNCVKEFIRYCLQQAISYVVVDTVSIPTWSISLWDKQYLPLPSYLEQQKIANYLDKVCGEVDEMIALQEQMIEELKAYKQSVITEAVTKGLNPNAPMRDSGIDWIGEVPEHWKLEPIKYCFGRRSEKNNPVKTKERLSLSIDKGVTLYAEKTTNLDRFKDDFTQYQLAYPHDIVLNCMNMIVGAVGLSKYMGCVSPVYYVIYPIRPEIDALYYSYLLNISTIRGVYYSLGKGIYAIERGEGRVNTCRLKVSYDDFGRLDIPIPPIDEQKEITEFIQNKCAEIDALIAIKQAKIDELKDYKKSVIYEYVTGKKEVV